MWRIKYYFLLILIVLKVNSSPSKNNNLINILNNFINEKLAMCNLILMHGPELGGIFGTLTHSEMILSRMQINGNFLKPNYELDSSVNFHRFLPEDQCSVNLIDLSTVDLETAPSIMENLLIQDFQPVTRKDEDYFLIFLQDKSEGIVYQFLAGTFAKKIKYKIVLTSSDDAANDIKGYLSYFFSWPWENPLISKIIPLDVTPEIDYMFPDVLQNWQGRQLRVSSPTRLLMGVRIARISGQWKLTRGHHAMLLWEMSRIYNFTYVAFPANGGGGTGFALKNGTWIGATGDLLAKRAEISLITGQIYPRSKLFGFTTPITYLEFIFTLGRPTPSFSWKAVIWPLHTTVWIISLCCIVMVGFTFYHISVKGGESWRFDTVVLYLLGSLMEQRFQKARSNGLRIACSSWMVVCLILATGYRSKLIQLLAFPVTIPPPATFDELVDSDYSWGLEGAGIGGSVYDNIKSSDNPVYMKLMAKMGLEPDPIPCFLKGLQRRFACLVYRSQTEFIFFKNFSTRTRKNWFYSAKEATFSPHAVGWAQEPRSVFRTNFDIVIRKVMSTGIVAKWVTMDYEKVRADRILWEAQTGAPPLYQETTLEGPQSISNNNLTGAYYLLVLGLSAAIISYILEKYLPRNITSYLIKLFKSEKATPSVSGSNILKVNGAYSRRNSTIFSESVL